MSTIGVSDFHLSSLLHPAHIVELKHYFTIHGENKQLSLDEFTSALQRVLGNSAIPETQIARMFNRIDANSDGSVSWDEWCDFFLMFDQRHINLYRDTHATTFKPAEGYSGRDPAIATKGGLIIYILALYVPMELLKPPLWLYVSCAQNGTITLWDPLTLGVVGSMLPRSSTQWTTHLVSLSIPDFIAASFVDQTIEIIQLSTLTVVEVLSALPQAATCMTAFRNADAEHIFAFGDMAGSLSMCTMKLKVWNHVEKSTLTRYNVHNDWITEIAYLAAYRYIITSSMDGYVNFISAADGLIQRQFDRHNSGVYTFYYSPQLNLLASSSSQNVLLWNPEQLDVLASLKGHASPVHQMCMDERSYKLFTLSMDKVFKVWDCYTYQCMQTIVDPTPYFPDNHIGRIFWDIKHQQLVSSTTRLRIWPIHNVLQSSTRKSHDCAITSASYTAALHQVATGDTNSAIHTWDVCTGELVMRIPRAHGEEQISVLTYDSNGKRVVSGAVDGTVNIWNGSNGQLLSRLHRPADPGLEISTIVYAVPCLKAKSLNQDRYILVGGWDKQLFKYKDIKSIDIYPLEEYIDPDHDHEDDVVALCFIPVTSALIVSASVDGKILIWSFTLRTIRHSLTLDASQKAYNTSFQVDMPSTPGDFVECLLTLPLIEGFVSGSAFGRIDFWCAATGRIQQSIITKQKQAITSLAVMIEDENLLVAGKANGELEIWDISRVLMNYNTTLDNTMPAVQSKPSRLIQRHQHPSSLLKWMAHASSDVVFTVFTNDLIMSAGKDGVLALWTQEGQQIGIFGHDAFNLIQRQSLVNTQTMTPQAPPPLRRKEAVKAVQSTKTNRFKPSDLKMTNRHTNQQTLSPRELRLRQANKLAVHTMTEVPRRVNDFIHKPLVDITEDEYRRKDAACNL